MAIIPFCHRDLSVVLVNQTRIACMVGGCSCDQWEIPAGLISQGESPSEAAKRAEEETGINNVELEYIYIFPSPGNIATRCSFFWQRFPKAKTSPGKPEFRMKENIHIFNRFTFRNLKKWLQTMK